MDLQDVALKIPAVKDLYDEVSAITPITFTESNDINGWTSITQNGQTRIGMSPTGTPGSALAHELLHAKLKLAGYRQISLFVSKPKYGLMLKSHLEVLDNELQHHKMFEQYVDLGLPGKNFYRDSDTNTFKKIRRELDRSRKTDPFDLFLPLFLSVVAQGGAGTETEREQLRRYFETRCSFSCWNKLLQVEAAFGDWRKSSNLDPSETIKRVLSLSDLIERAWIGTNRSDFPTSGIFVGMPFSAKEAQAWHGLL
ncbi:hypothetical protein [Caballeronia sp. KNU42]